MLVVLIVVAAAIVVGAVAVALGRGGEMAQFTADFAPVDLGDIDEVTATDVALLRLPRALWGYHSQVTDHALGLIAQTISARDVEIATLQRQLAEVHPAAGAGQQEKFPLPEQLPRQQPPLPPPVAGVAGAAAAGPPLPSRPSVRRREMTDQPAMEQPSADSWPPQDPWSGWQRRSAAASGAREVGRAPDTSVPDAGVPDAGVPDAGTTPDTGVPDAGTTPDTGVPDAGTSPDTGVPDAGTSPGAGPPPAFAPPHDQAPAAGSDPGSAPDSDPGVPAPGSDPGVPREGG